MDSGIVPRSFGTHDGTFHADEVTACALLLHFQLIDDEKIVRTRDPEKLALCEYVCDVGGVYDPQIKRFDHHQVGYQGELSSAGMILQYLKEEKKIGDPIYLFLNRSLILGVDAHDNGRVAYETGWCSFSHVISNFVPIEYDASHEEQTQGFYRALAFVLGHLARLLERFAYTQSCKEMIAKAMESKEKFLMFDRSIPWLESFFELGGEEHPALFVVMPSSGHWKLRAIPPNLMQRMQVRHPLPEEWAGLHDEELVKVCKIPGAVFCHKGRFVSVWKSKSDALSALKYVLTRVEK